MARATYTNIAIVVGLAAEIDKVIKSNRLGYRSRSEFAAEAIRRLLSETTKR